LRHRDATVRFVANQRHTIRDSGRGGTVIINDHHGSAGRRVVQDRFNTLLEFFRAPEGGDRYTKAACRLVGGDVVSSVDLNGRQHSPFTCNPKILTNMLLALDPGLEPGTCGLTIRRSAD